MATTDQKLMQTLRIMKGMGVPNEIIVLLLDYHLQLQALNEIAGTLAMALRNEGLHDVVDDAEKRLGRTLCAGGE